MEEEMKEQSHEYSHDEISSSAIVDNNNVAADVGVYSATDNKPKSKESRERSRDNDRERDRDRHRSRDDDVADDRHKSKKKKKDKDRERSRERSKDRDRDRERHRDHDRDRDRDRERSGRHHDTEKRDFERKTRDKDDQRSEYKKDDVKAKPDAEVDPSTSESKKESSPRSRDDDNSKRKRKDRDDSVESRRRDDRRRDDRDRDRDDRRGRSRERDSRRYDNRSRRDRSYSDDRDYSRRSRDRPRIRDRSNDRSRNPPRDRSKERPYDRTSDRPRDPPRDRSDERRDRSPPSRRYESSKSEPKADVPKKITLKDIMAANPGISLQEAISKLSSYNTAVAMGLSVAELPSFASADMGSPSAQALNAAAINASLSGIAGIIGDSSALSKPHRELYIGNLPPGCTSSQITEFLNTCMKQIGYSNPIGSIVTAWISSDGHYAFVEFRTVEEANAALNQLNGVSVGAFQLKIGRPKGYTGGSTVGLSSGMGMMNQPLGLGLMGSAQPAAPSIVSSVAMITNLPLAVSNDQARELVSSFGTLKAFNCIKSSAGTQTAIFEYVDQAATDLAVVGLSNIDLIGTKLMVQKIPANAAEMLLKPVGGTTDMNSTTMKSPPISSSASSLSSSDDRNSRIEPTRVIRLSNMTTDEDLQDDELYEDLREEIKEECSKHGHVLSVAIPRYGAGVGFVFVEFGSVVDAGKGYRAIAGRKFSGNTVVGSYFPEDLFAKKEYMLPHDFKV